MDNQLTIKRERDVSNPKKAETDNRSTALSSGRSWRVLIALFAIIAVGLLKLVITLENWQWSLILAFFSIAGFVAVLYTESVEDKPLVRGFRLFFSVYVLAFFIIELLYGISVTGYSATDVLNSLSPYLCVLFAFPVLHALKRGYVSFDRLLLAVLVITFISLVVRTALSFVQTNTGIALCPGISLEHTSENWIRNGVVRINPPSLAILVVGICMYNILYGKKHACLNVIILGWYLFYSQTIHAARGVLLYSVITVLLLVIFKRTKSRGTYIALFSIGLFCCVVAVYEPLGTGIASFLSSFFDTSASNEYAGSTIARQNGLAFFSSLYFHINPVMGFSVFSYTDLLALSGGYTVDDLGFFGFVFRFGIPGILLYALIIGRAIYAFVKARNAKFIKFEAYSSLLAGFVIAALLTSINIELFYMYAASVPFIIAASEYILIKLEQSSEANDGSQEFLQWI
jgi:hypothetical protein